MIAIPRSIARIPLLRGLVRVVLAAWANVFYGRYLVERRQGLTLLLDRSNAVDWLLHTSGTWEPESVERLFALVEKERTHCPDGAVFLDIGAHWGFYALLAHRKGWFERIVAFEPDPANYAQLQANLFLNQASAAIEALKLAASDREATFGLRVDSRNRGGTQLVAAGRDTVTCQAVRIDQRLDFAGKLLVVKMDVETHEEAALDGLLSLLAKNHCVLQIEVWTGAESRDDDRPRRVIERLARLGIRHVDTFDSDYFFVSERRGK
ncbi:MAG: FkbM family methyltransferase [Reyranella sp.]|uniref:FkbM family methyltransferase n=1 Tax=Reyranella sp. TaxID=1929291 RepID=UPI001AD377CC|nr:FkbM family methyltransferase [Reyranella sp.]MBN9085502.1 FkbM family methyltransferase [Reyranella sp.]